MAGATAVAWAAAPGGASVRERFAAGGADGDDMALCGSKSTSLAFHPYVSTAASPKAAAN